MAALALHPPRRRRPPPPPLTDLASFLQFAFDRLICGSFPDSKPGLIFPAFQRLSLNFLDNAKNDEHRRKQAIAAENAEPRPKTL